MRDIRGKFIDFLIGWGLCMFVVCATVITWKLVTGGLDNEIRSHLYQRCVDGNSGSK